MERVILHCDMNNFYASVECLYNPELRDKPVAVGGNPEQRHGIVLAKNYLAKAKGVKTGEALWEAKKKCPDIVFVPPHFDKYLRFAKLAREIYADYTDQIEPFGLDEAWLDVTGSLRYFGKTGEEIANEIRARIREELGITASIGVSYNKVLSKLGSDLKKPDATTVITKENFKDMVWPLPVGDLLYVGPATEKKLHRYGIFTVGMLARTDPAVLKRLFGINGLMLHRFANGIDHTRVQKYEGEQAEIKSVGNSTTTPRDLVCENDVKITLFLLSDSVAARLREAGLVCRTVQISVRDSKLNWFERQCTLPDPTCTAADISQAALQLFCENVRGEYALRSLGVRACNLAPADYRQTRLFADKSERTEKLETAIDDIRRRFGHYSVRRAILLTDPKLSNLNPKDDHVIHPVAFLQ